jgi:type IV secretory pathway TraG/TraD family ATPase VirD4
VRPGPARGGARPDLLAWAIVGLLWGAVVFVAVVWTVAWLAAAVGGGRVAPPGADFAGHLVRGRTDLAWPGVGAGWLAASAVLVVLVLAGAAAGAVLGWRRWAGRRRRDDRWRLALPSLAAPADVAVLTPAGVAARARALRPSLADDDADAGGGDGGGGRRRRRLDPDEAGWPLGVLEPRGPQVRGTWEDVAVAFMAPRSGKTTALAVPMVLAAPGAVVATANKADLWAATAALREAAGSRAWTFDPQSIAYAEQEWWWDPLAAVDGIEDADRLASHFIQEIRGGGDGAGGRDFWASAAGDLLASLLLAAAVSKRSLVDVYAWLNDASSPLPADELAACGYPAVAAGLRGRQHGAPETVQGIYETARAAARCLRNDRILRWVTPGHVGPQFDVAAFAAGRDTLYLLSKSEEGAAAPLVSALTDQVMRAAVRRAEAHGGRVDPPMLVCLDEAANICKIGDLPDLYSHLGSRGLVTLTVLQSYQQGVRVWGKAGMDALWSAATIKIVGAGIDDPQMAEDLSRLAGEHDVVTESTTHSPQGYSLSTSLRRQRVLEAADVRALPKGRALLLATGSRIAALRLRPWYAGPRRDEIAAAVAAATDQLTRRARGDPDPDDTAAMETANAEPTDAAELADLATAADADETAAEPADAAEIAAMARPVGGFEDETADAVDVSVGTTASDAPNPEINP